MKYFKYLIWAGRVKKVECKQHSYSFSGKIPCTGNERCIFCGKIKEKK